MLLFLALVCTGVFSPRGREQSTLQSTPTAGIRPPASPIEDAAEAQTSEAAAQDRSQGLPDTKPEPAGKQTPSNFDLIEAGKTTVLKHLKYPGQANFPLFSTGIQHPGGIRYLVTGTVVTPTDAGTQATLPWSVDLRAHPGNLTVVSCRIAGEEVYSLDAELKVAREAGGPVEVLQEPKRKRLAEKRDFPVRTWTDAGGKHTTEAVFVSQAGDLVRLRKADGSEVRLKLDQLSQADRDWIQEQSR